MFVPPVWVIDLAFGLFCTATGVAGAAWLRARKPVDERQQDNSRRRGVAEEALHGLHAAVESVQSCVLQHNECLNAINASLAGGDAADAAASIIEASQLAEHQFLELKGDIDAQADTFREETGSRATILLTTLALDRQKHTYQRVLSSLQTLAAEMSGELDGCGAKLRTVSAGLESTRHTSATEVRHAIGSLLEAVDVLGQSADAAEVRLEQSAQKISMQAILSHADLLTSLPNRRALEEQLAAETASNGMKPAPCSLVLLDLDRFAAVNARYGYAGGDAVLRQAAQLLKRVSKGRESAARFGGDCFALTLPGATLAKAMPVAERVRSEVAAARFTEGRHRLALTASVGVVQLQHGERPGQAIIRATMAVKEASAAGGDSAYYNDGQQCFPISAAHQKPKAERRANDSPEFPTADALAGDAAQAAEDSARAGEPTLCGRSIFVASVKRRLSEWSRGGPTVAVLLMRVDQANELMTRHSSEAMVFLRRVLGRLLEAATRDMDQRCDYEEGVFAVLLPGADETTALAIADRLRSQVSNCKLRLDNELWDLSASIGVADAPSGASAVDLLMAAAAAMELAVRDGGDAVCAYSQMPQGSPAER